MLVGGVIPITDLAAVAEGAGVLAAFGTMVKIMVHSSSAGSWPKGRKRAAMRKMVPTPTKRARRFCLTSKLQEVQLYIFHSPQLRARLPAAFLRKSMS